MIKKKFTFAPLTALMNLGPSESMVWTCMLTFQGNNKYAWPTLEAVSKRLGGKLKPKRISQILIQLQKKGWMHKIRRGYGKSNLYQCLTPDNLLFQPNFGESTLESKVILKTEPIQIVSEPKIQYIESESIDENDPFIMWFTGKTDIYPRELVQ
jgi:hypothetical protein